MVKKPYDVIIVGGGPAGASAAIHLAKNNVGVLLIEQRTFPRPKLCGEFISPECFGHFAQLEVVDEIKSHGPAFVTHTVFYSERGRSIAIPSAWFASGPALGLSRASMDHILLGKAERLGVTVLQNSLVNELVIENDVPCGVRVRHVGEERTYFSTLTIDATGRSRVLARKATAHRASKPNMVAFKAHFRKTRSVAGSCEIYSYRRGYGGLSTIEDGLSNLCFIASAKDVRKCRSNPTTVLKDVVMKNRRANYTLERAEMASEWLSVSVESFGSRAPSLIPGLIAIGDAAAFIDPFTGSGILMALESGKLAAETIVRNFDKSKSNDFLMRLSLDYERSYRRKFSRRLMFCSLLRRTAFRPSLADLMIATCNVSELLRNRIALATRSSVGKDLHFEVREKEKQHNIYSA